MLYGNKSALMAALGACLLLGACGSATPDVVRETVEVTRVVSPTAPAATAVEPVDAPTQPPTQAPTLPPTPAPTQAPTPTPLVIVVVPIEGTPIMRLVFADYAPAATTALDFKVEARFGDDAPDGTGIAEVIFEIFGPNGNTVYQRIERRTGFCAFGGGEPNCNVWNFAEHNSNWPNGLPIENGPHELEVTVRADPSFVDGGNSQWTSNRVRFAVQPPPRQAGLTAYIDAPQPGDLTLSDRAYFRVIAFDPAAGAQDGAGISHIDLFVVENPGGQVVHQATERAARYCAFGGNDACNEWFFADNGFSWPGGQPIRSGTYILQAVVHGQSGGTTTVETTVDIDLEN